MSLVLISLPNNGETSNCIGHMILIGVYSVIYTLFKCLLNLSKIDAILIYKAAVSMICVTLSDYTEESALAL